MHFVYDPQSEDWSVCLLADNSDLQYGNGDAQWGYFQGTPYQRGAGLGDIFRSVYRLLLPLGRAAGAALGKEGLQTAHRVLSEVVAGQKPTEALKKETKTGVRNLLLNAANSMQQQGEGRKRGQRLCARGGPLLKASRKASRKRKDVFGEY